MITKRLLRSLPLAFALLTVFAWAPPAAAQTTDQLPRCHDRRAIFRFLGLSREQAAKFRACAEQLHQVVEPLYEQIEPLKDELEMLLEGTNPPPGQVGQIVIDIDALRDEIKLARSAFGECVRAFLTPEQLVKWNALQAKCGRHEDD